MGIVVYCWPLETLTEQGNRDVSAVKGTGPSYNNPPHKSKLTGLSKFAKEKVS